MKAIKTTRELCLSCKYGCLVYGGNGNKYRADGQQVACDYILMNPDQRSRVFEGEKRRLKPGMCDKYEQKKCRRKRKSTD